MSLGYVCKGTQAPSPNTAASLRPWSTAAPHPSWTCLTASWCWWQCGENNCQPLECVSTRSNFSAAASLLVAVAYLLGTDRAGSSQLPLPPTSPFSHKMLGFIKFTKARWGDRTQDLPCLQQEHQSLTCSVPVPPHRLEQTVPLSRLRPSHWSAFATATICLVLRPSYCRGKKKKKEKIESWLTHFLTFQGRVHVWELSWCPDCSGTLSPPDPNRPAGLQWVPSLGALQITPPPSPSSSTLPSYRIWDYEFHLNTGCSDRMQPCVIITWKL